MKPSRLGRGLEALLGHAKEEQPQGSQILDLAVSQIHPNPNQPRQDFDPVALGELVESIHRNGILQPVIVRADADGYQLIAGERRWRAAMQAGLATVPAIVRTATDNETLELALVENIQRQDLNPIEQARAYKELIERFGLTQEEASSRLGKNRSSIANMLRLLDLPQDIQDAVSRGTLSMGHARALLGLSDRNEQRRLATRVQADDLSVRQTERLVADRLRRSRATPAPDGPRPAHLTDLERQLREALGTRVTIIQHKNSSTGRISIDFFSHDDFQRVLACIVGPKSPPQSPPPMSPPS
jgi:ParB family chromosome partitioning protein